MEQYVDSLVLNIPMFRDYLAFLKQEINCTTHKLIGVSFMYLICSCLAISSSRIFDFVRLVHVFSLCCQFPC